MKFLPTVLLIFSIFCYILFGFFLYQRFSYHSIAFATPPETTSVNTSSVLPSQIIIDTLSINLPIYPARINGTTWETTSNGVSYLLSSPVPGESGNSILYGHNWNSLLGGLHNIHKGDIIDIYFSDHTSKEFSVTNIQVVRTDNTTVLEQTTDKRITLYTCSGFLDLNRLVVTAELQE